MNAPTCSPLTRSGHYPDAIPVTVLTGFLGSGKTTLLNHLLRSRPRMRIAVIENEFGQIGVDNDLVFTSRKNLFELSDGCVCCTMRPELMRILGLLADRTGKYDHLIIETTGLADPAPVAQTFFVDDKVKRRARLNAVVTVVDAKHVLHHVEESRACLDQIAFADIVLLNKCDLATPEELERVERRIRQTNSAARIERVTFGEAPAETILDQGGFDLERALQAKPAFLKEEYPFEHVATYDLPGGDVELRVERGLEVPIGVVLVPATKLLRTLEREVLELVMETDAPEVQPGATVPLGRPAHLVAEQGAPAKYPVHLPAGGPYALFVQFDPREAGLALTDPDGRAHRPESAVDYTLGHAHDAAVTSVSVRSTLPVDDARLGKWLASLLHEKSAALYRVKGIVNVAGKDSRFVVHGVHSLLNFTEDRPWERRESRLSQMVFIGRDLDRKALARGFRACLTRSRPANS